jgi:replication-associated recombination protein RarA
LAGNRLPPTENGYEFGECSSAMQKCIRRGDEKGALYWAVELDKSGYGEYVWKRLRIMTSEDVGLAEPTMPAVIHGLYETWAQLKKKKDDRQEPWRLQLVHAVILLSRARKSRIVDHALLVYYMGDLPRLEVPDVAKDKHTLAGKRKGRGWQHFFDEGTLLNDGEGELKTAPHLDDPYRAEAERILTAGDQSQLAPNVERA